MWYSVKNERQVCIVIANYHTHTHRCRHASGRETEYVQAALKMGLTTLGFSDHTPYWFNCDYYSSFRMFPEQLPDYVETVLKLRETYQGKIQIPLGLETEYYPAYFPELLERVRDAGIEYLLLGQHFVGNEVGEPYCGRPTDDVTILKRYCQQAADAMYTGLFSYLAHPDLLYFTGDDKVYRSCMQVICRAAKDCGLPLEVNLLGIYSGRHYPNPVFWELAAEEGCSVVMGRDAHTPEQLLNRDSEIAAQRMIEKLGLQFMEQVDLRQI